MKINCLCSWRNLIELRYKSRQNCGTLFYWYSGRDLCSSCNRNYTIGAKSFANFMHQVRSKLNIPNAHLLAKIRVTVQLAPIILNVDYPCSWETKSSLWDIHTGENLKTVDTIIGSIHYSYSWETLCIMTCNIVWHRPGLYMYITTLYGCTGTEPRRGHFLSFSYLVHTSYILVLTT